MNPGPARYTARWFGSGHWRIWDRKRHQWLEERSSSYPEESLRMLNGHGTFSPWEVQPARVYHRLGLPYLVSVTILGGVLGGVIGVWLLLRGDSLQSDDGCGLFAVFMFLLVLFVGANLGGILSLIAGLLYNTVVDRRNFNSMMAAFDSRWGECLADPSVCGDEPE
jgi:hypothetical protein